MLVSTFSGGSAFFSTRLVQVVRVGVGVGRGLRLAMAMAAAYEKQEGQSTDACRWNGAEAFIITDGPSFVGRYFFWVRLIMQEFEGIPANRCAPVLCRSTAIGSSVRQSMACVRRIAAGEAEEELALAGFQRVGEDAADEGEEERERPQPGRVRRSGW